VVGECAGLYQFDGKAWHPVEMTGELGRVRVRTRLDAVPAGSPVQLLVGGQEGQERSLSVEGRDDGRAVLVLRLPDRTVRGDPFEVDEADEVVDARFDRRLHTVAVWLDQRVVLGDTFYGAPDDDLRVASDWPAPAEVLTERTPACDGLGP
jgi:hypothetical protein